MNKHKQSMGDSSSPASARVPDSDSESETSGSSAKRKRHLSTPPRTNLPHCVSLWKRQHAEKLLHIFYAQKAVQDLKQKLSGTIQELTKEQKDYIDFVNKHLTINLSLNQFYHQSQFAEQAIIECGTRIEKMQAENKSWSIMKLKAFIRGLRNLFRNMRDYRKSKHQFEGLLTGFIGKFADLCCLDVEYCNKAHQAIWKNLKGTHRVISEPDLRLRQCGIEDNYSETMVTVMQVKPDSSYCDTPMGPPRKKSRGSPSSSPDQMFQTLLQSEEGAIELDLPLHDKVLGQHAGELLLDLHLKYWRDEKDKYKGDKNINMLGMIVDGTSVFFTVLEMSWKHYQKLKDNEDLDEHDKATIYYSNAKDILIEMERKSLIADFMRLNNIELF